MNKTQCKYNNRNYITYEMLKMFLIMRLFC